MTACEWAHPVVLVDGQARHREFVRLLSAEVFSHFGDYDRSLPRLLDRPGVGTVVAESAGGAVGFAMYIGDDSVAELLAIAVTLRMQGHGVGRRLLEHVECRVREAGPGERDKTLCLTVATANAAARRLFEAAGYEIVGGCAGSYPGGQESMEMEKSLPRV